MYDLSSLTVIFIRVLFKLVLFVVAFVVIGIRRFMMLIAVLTVIPSFIAGMLKIIIGWVMSKVPNPAAGDAIVIFLCCSHQVFGIL